MQSALLIGASSPKEVSIILADSHPHKYLVFMSYVFSNIRDKLLFEEGERTGTHMQNADIIVTASLDLFAKSSHDKVTILLVEEAPIQKSVFYKLKQDEPCGTIKQE